MKKKLKLVTVLLTVILVASVCLFYACQEKEVNRTNATDESSRENQTPKSNNENLALSELDLREITGSDFVLKLLKIANVKKITFEKGTDCQVFFGNDEYCDVKVAESDRFVSINFENYRYQLSFQEDRFFVNDLTRKKKIEYFNISDVAENIDKTILISIAIMHYLQEIGIYNYLERFNPYGDPSYAKGHVCIHPRLSWCTEERRITKMTEYCGGAPCYVGNTDCGCLWGDFLCICLTDFKCDCS